MKIFTGITMVNQPVLYKIEKPRKFDADSISLSKSWKTRFKTRSDPFWNIFAGSFGGICSLVVGYPLDTIKVRLQTQNSSDKTSLPYRGALDCFRQTVAKNGVWSLFRGMSAPALFATPRFAIIFHANAHSLNFVRGKLGDRFERRDLKSGIRINYLEVCASGAMSQLVVVPCLVAPVERIKVLLQVYPPEKFRGQLHCLTHLIRTEGLRSLWRGTLLTYARDIPSFGTYFFTYELLRHEIFMDHETGYVGLRGTVMSGAIAGLCGWSVAIPFDVVKNRHQSICNLSAKISSWTTIKSLYATEGLLGFYRGAGPILLRAAPANAVGLLGYEAAISLIARCRDEIS